MLVEKSEAVLEKRNNFLDLKEKAKTPETAESPFFVNSEENIYE